MHNVVIPFAIATAILLCDYYKKTKLWILGYALIILGFLLYVSAFLIDDFTLKEVFLHSSRSLDLKFKLSASWAGSGGFLVWWLFVFTTLSLSRRIKGLVHYNPMIVALFLVALINGAFDSLSFIPKDGMGLNPSLKTVWMLFHPPATFTAYALGFLIAIDVFAKVESEFAIGMTWLFVTLANVLGGVWSYFTLGWGGYWAWDPVETSLLLPWLSLTAYFHLRRSYLISLTGFSIAFAGFVTRGGISTLHGFAINPTSCVIVFLGIPFLIRAIKDFKIDSLKPVNAVAYSLLGSYLVCLLGVVYQIVNRVSVSVDYYNFANMPFLVAFLSLFPMCRGDWRECRNKLLAVYALSTLLAILTIIFDFKWCVYAPKAVNVAVSFVIPLAIFSLVHSLKVDGLGLKLIHVSIPLLIIAVSVSWPYTYYSNYKSVIVGKTRLDGLNVELSSIDFKEVGAVYFGGVVIPEEFVEIVKVKVDGRCVENVVRLNLPYLLSGREFVYSEPSVLNVGLDDYYLVLPNDMIFNYDLVMFTCRYLYERNETHVLRFVAKNLNVDYDKLLEKVRVWKPKGEVLILHKRIPLINLVWISCGLMVIGGVLTRWRR